MSTKVQVKTQTKTPAASAPAYARQPPLAMPERQVERPDIATQLEGAARLGHSLGTFDIESIVPLQIQARPPIQRQPVRENEDEEEELQLQREPDALQRQELPEDDEEELQMKPDIPQVGLEGGPVPPEIESAIQQARGCGQPLDETIQAQMGERLGHDFSNVRVHTDAEADTLNQQLSARAFTTGRDIFFRQSLYNPGSGSGRELLAHELSHVVQQSSGRVPGGGNGMTVRPADDSLEQEADSVKQIVSDQPIHRSALIQPSNTDMSIGQSVQRDCWTMSVQQRASFDNAVFRHYNGGTRFWRLQDNTSIYHGSFFSPDLDGKVDQILEDGRVDVDERRQLAVKHEWVKEWKFLFLYDVTPNNRKLPYTGIVGAQQERGPDGELLPGGAEQVVFSPNRADKNVRIVKWGYVEEEKPYRRMR